MHLATPAAVAFGLTLLTAAGGDASAQNLIVNGDFDTGLAGWSDAPRDVTATWTDALDAGGSTTSGSVLLENTGGESTLWSFTSIQQCVPISPGGPYRFGGSIYVPDGQTATGYANLGVGWYTAGDCSPTTAVGFNAFGYVEGTAEEWVASELLSGDWRAHSVSFHLVVHKSEPGGSFAAYFDDVYMIAPEPGATLVGVAALGAVALSARLRRPRRARAGAARSPRRRA